jgi:hypothetical protein
MIKIPVITFQLQSPDTEIELLLSSSTSSSSVSSKYGSVSELLRCLIAESLRPGKLVHVQATSNTVNSGFQIHPTLICPHSTLFGIVARIESLIFIESTEYANNAKYLEIFSQSPNFMYSQSLCYHPQYYVKQTMFLNIPSL